MEKQIYAGEAQAGRAEVALQDGYFRIEAFCAFREGIWRLYLTDGERSVRLGVMIPDSDGLRLSKRVTPRALGISPEEGRFVLLPGEQTPSAAAEKEDAPEETENRPEASSDAPAGQPDRWLACPSPGPMTRDALLGQKLLPLEGVLYRYRSGGVELAVPAENAQDISLLLCLTRAEHIREKDYFIIRLDPAGDPAPAMQPSTY